jgi:VacB/RNase II family 3'-5' exoribonuclease
MRERGLLPEFSPAALRQAATMGQREPPAGTAPRDLRALPWVSIDNDDSRDLDQLSAAEALAGGTVKILVAIADVESAVPMGSSIDEHAHHNTTSVYTAARVFSMLPEALSTDRTSLNEGQERLAIVVEMLVASDGMLEGAGVYRAAVRSRAQLTYNSVAAWLDGLAPAPPKVQAAPDLAEQLRLQDRAAQALKEAQRRRGALEFATPTARPVFENGVLTDLRPDEKNRAKELISVFMIAANGVTARFLDGEGFPTLRRMLHAPRRWDRIVTLAAGLGRVLPAEPDPVALNAFLTQQRVAEPARFADLSLAVVKLLGSGEYVARRAGQAGVASEAQHFGLAVNDYAHSTAPNRRFPDLVTQRLIKAALARVAPPYSDEALDALARHCTVQEDNAGKVERQVRKSAAALLLAPRIGESFQAIVTGASEKGCWVRTGGTLGTVVEGRVVEGQAGLDVGDRVRVELLRVDAALGFIDFKVAAPL